MNMEVLAYTNPNFFNLQKWERASENLRRIDRQHFLQLVFLLDVECAPKVLWIEGYSCNKLLTETPFTEEHIREISEPLVMVWSYWQKKIVAKHYGSMGFGLEQKVT